MQIQSKGKTLSDLMLRLAVNALTTESWRYKNKVVKGGEHFNIFARKFACRNFPLAMMINEKVSKFLIYHKGIAVTERLCMYILHLAWGVRWSMWPTLFQNICNRCDVLAHTLSCLFCAMHNDTSQRLHEQAHQIKKSIKCTKINQNWNG